MIEPMPTVDDALAQLAAAPPSEFTRERNALVARLTKLGQAEAAARVKAMPRPTATVWAVNRLAREHPTSIEQLIVAADAMRAAQLGRAEAGGLAAASSSHREILASLSERAELLLRQAGLGVAHQTLLRVETTLTAAAADPKLQPALRQGRLERELAARGFEVFAGEELPARRRTPASPRGAPAPRGEATAVAAGGETAAETERQQARLAKAREALAQAEGEATRQRERLAAARRRATEQREILREAMRAVVRAAEDEKRAARVLRKAQKDLRAAERARGPITRKPRV